MTEKPLEEEVAELEQHVNFDSLSTLLGFKPDFFARLITDWRKRGERIEELQRDVEFYQLEAVARTGTDARTKP